MVSFCELPQFRQDYINYPYSESSKIRESPAPPFRENVWFVSTVESLFQLLLSISRSRFKVFVDDLFCFFGSNWSDFGRSFLGVYLSRLFHIPEFALDTVAVGFENILGQFVSAHLLSITEEDEKFLF